jgi:glutamate 5-kinase
MTYSRDNILRHVKRVVIKIGSGALTAKDGLNLELIHALCEDLCTLIRKKGLETVLVSSGAIACGMKKMGLSRRPQSISQQQAAAAIGQSDAGL